MKKNKGFSLVELIVVVAIMAILAAVAIPTFSMFIRKAQEASDRAFMNDVEYALMLVYVDEPEARIGDVYVYVDPETNKVAEIKYDLDYKGEVIKHYFPRDDRTKIDDASALIDWDYQFKALDLQENTYEWAEGNWHFEAYEEELDQSQAGGDGNVDINTPGDNGGGETFDENDIIIGDETDNAVDSENNDDETDNEFDWIIDGDLAGP